MLFDLIDRTKILDSIERYAWDDPTVNSVVRKHLSPVKADVFPDPNIPTLRNG